MIELAEKFTSLIKNDSKIRNEKYDYRTNFGFFGYSLVRIAGGKYIYSPKGLLNKIDRVGDSMLRRFDDNLPKAPVKLWLRHPKWIYKMLNTEPKRYRGEVKQVLANVTRLELDEFYGQHCLGIELKKPNILTEGINLYDIYSQDIAQITPESRRYALFAVGEYLNNLHSKFGAIGEVHTSDIFFQNFDNYLLSNPVLALPDIIWNKKIYNDEKLKTASEPKGIDLLDFLTVIAYSESIKNQNPILMQEALNNILCGYGNRDIIKTTLSLAKRGRLNIEGDKDNFYFRNFISQKFNPVFLLHNRIRLGINKDITINVREQIISSCIKVLK